MVEGKSVRVYFALVLFICSIIFGLIGQPSMAALSDVDWNNFQREASNALDGNKYWIAEPMLKKAMAEAELFGFNDLRLARSLSELGRYYTIRGRFDVAQPYLEREFAVREVAYGKDDGRMIQPMGSLITFYLTYGTASKAEPLTEDLLAFVEGKIAESHFQNEKKASLTAGQPLTGYAGTAAPAMRDPLLEWSIVCDNLANLYRARKEYKYAERLFKDALDIKATVLGKGHLSLANSYDSLGVLAMETKEYKEAEGYFRDALRTTQDTLPPESPEIYGRLDKLAKCLIKEEKYEEAENLYKSAFALWSKAPSKTGDESRCWYALGSLYILEKKYGAAAPCLSRALHMAEKFSGPYSMVLCPYLEMYAYDLYYLGRRGETAALRARSLAISGPKVKPPADKKDGDGKDEGKDRESKDGDSKDASKKKGSDKSFAGRRKRRNVQSRSSSGTRHTRRRNRR